MKTFSKISETAAAARIATTLMFLVNGLGMGAWAVCIPGFKTRLTLSNVELSLTLFAMAAGAVLSLPAGGLLGPLLGTGRSTRLSCVAFAIALLFPAMSHHPAGLAAAMFFVGATSGLLDVSMNAHATFVEKRRGVAIMSSFHAAWSAGGLVGAILGALLVSAGVDSSLVLPLVGGLTAITLAASWTSLGAGEITEKTARFAWPGRVAIPLCTAALLCMMCEGAMNDWSSVYLTTVMAAGQALAAVAYGSFAATMLIGRLVGDWVVRALNRETVVRFGSALAAGGLFIVGFAPGPWWSIVGFALVGLGLSNVVPALFSESGSLGIPPATGIAMTATAGYTGFLVGPPLVGAVATMSGLRASMLLLGAAAASVAILASVMKHRRTPAATRVLDPLGTLDNQPGQ